MSQTTTKKRVKYVVSESEVAHLWANKVQDSARYAQTVLK